MILKVYRGVRYEKYKRVITVVIHENREGVPRVWAANHIVDAAPITNRSNAPTKLVRPICLVKKYAGTAAGDTGDLDGLVPASMIK